MQQSARRPESEQATSLPGDSPVLAVFLNAARRLTARQDRHERLVKQSRDITIESKRIIFLLHSPVTKDRPKEKVIREARDRLLKLINGPIMAIALELENAPAHMHSKAYTAGLQEFVEARSFCSFLEQNTIITLEEIRKELIFSLKSKDGIERSVSILLTPQDYILGLADLTGEVMRSTINQFASGVPNQCVFACDMLRRVYTGFLGLHGGNQLLTSKLNTTWNNVLKVEQSLFAYAVRGIEVIRGITIPQPKARISWGQPIEEDQGCY